jgi:voltage-gated potassium channel
VPDADRHPVRFSRLRTGQLLPRPRFIVVLALLIGILIVLPMYESVTSPSVSRALALFGLIVPLMAVSAAGDTGWARWIALILAGSCLVTSGGDVAGLGLLPPQAGIVLTLLFLAYSTVRLIAGVARSARVTGDVIAGALAGYIMAGLTWAVAYGLVETVAPGSIRGLSPGSENISFGTLVYFSYITQLTIGYGDITPVSPVARNLAVMEGLGGMTFTTIILAVLVAAYLIQRTDTGAK